MSLYTQALKLDNKSHYEKQTEKLSTKQNIGKCLILFLFSRFLGSGVKIVAQNEI